MRREGNNTESGREKLSRVVRYVLLAQGMLAGLATQAEAHGKKPRVENVRVTQAVEQVIDKVGEQSNTSAVEIIEPTTIRIIDDALEVLPQPTVAEVQMPKAHDEITVRPESGRQDDAHGEVSLDFIAKASNNPDGEGIEVEQGSMHVFIPTKTGSVVLGAERRLGDEHSEIGITPANGMHFFGMSPGAELVMHGDGGKDYRVFLATGHEADTSLQVALNLNKPEEGGSLNRLTVEFSKRLGNSEVGLKFEEGSLVLMPTFHLSDRVDLTGIIKVGGEGGAAAVIKIALTEPTS